MLLPSALRDETRETQSFYKLLERYLVHKSLKQETKQVEVPWQTLETLAKQAGVREPYSIPLKKFIKFGLIGRSSGYHNANGNGNGLCKRMWLEHLVEEDYKQHQLPCATLKKEKRSLRVDVSRCRANQWREVLKPVFAKSVKRFEYDRELCVDAIEKSFQSIVAKQAHFGEVFSETRWLSVHEGRRVYTSFVNSPRYLRQFVRLEGEPLVEFDAANLHYSLIAHASDDQELLRCCHTGRFYERLCDELGLEPGSHRAEVKRLALSFLNCRNSQRTVAGAPLKELRRALSKHFAKAFEFQKQVKQEDHTMMNQLLDRLEWQAMMPLCLKIREQVAKPAGKHILPLHDAVYVPESIADDVWTLIQDEKPKHIQFKDGRQEQQQPVQDEFAPCLC